jgi:Domain of unknown function (DUF4124)
MMRVHLLRAALPAFLIGAMGMQAAHADIYTWVDASGSINVSNLQPPEGVRVTNVMHESAPRLTPPADAALQANVQALAQRVSQLEGELATAQYQAPPPPAYAYMPPPPVVQYFIDVAPPQVQYNSVGQSGCDPAWADCGNGWNGAVFPAGVYFLQAPYFRRAPYANSFNSFNSPRRSNGMPPSRRRG